MTHDEQINAWANRALENMYGGWHALAESQIRLIIDATGGIDPVTQTYCEQQHRAAARKPPADA